MNIWVIGRSYPQKINNMQGSFELEQAKMLAKHCNSVAYIACVFHPFKKVKKWGFCHWQEDEISIFTYSQIYAIERMKLHLEPFKAVVWRKLLNQVEQETGVPDVIHVHYPSNITVAKDILEYKKKGAKIVCTEHWSQVLKNAIDFYEREQLKLYADNADAMLCVGSPLRDSVKEITNSKRNLYVVPNIVNEMFRPTKYKREGYNFIAVSALFPIKQFDRIISAFAMRFQNQNNVKLTIVGGGPEEAHLKHLAKELGVENQVVFTGKRDRSETAFLVASSDALICYSNCETFGVPIIEAWACGLPVIATTAAAVRDGWDEKLGVQVSPYDLGELQNAMQYVYEHRSEYDPKYIAQYAAEHYSENTVYEMLMNYYS